MSLAGRKRVYKEVSVRHEDGLHVVLLDGRVLTTPARNRMALPTGALAETVAGEWRAQGQKIDPETMPMTQLASTMLDRVVPNRAEMIDLLLGYAETDLLCYRAEEPPDLVARQDRLWQPVLDWLAARHGADLSVTRGILPIAQPKVSLAALRRAIGLLDDPTLTGLQMATASMGSLVLGLALVEGRLSPEEAFAASQLDETFQAEFWGEDPEAAKRRHALSADVGSAARFTVLARSA